MKGMGVAQPIWLSGCPEKGHFSAKNAFLMIFFASIFPNLDALNFIIF